MTSEKKSTSGEVSHISQLAFFKVFSREIPETVSDQETKLIYGTTTFV